MVFLTENGPPSLRAERKFPGYITNLCNVNCSLRELMLLITQDQVWNEHDKGHCG